MIIVFTCQEKDENGKVQTYIDHGIDLETGSNVVMQQEDIRFVNYLKFNTEIGSYIIKETNGK